MKIIILENKLQDGVKSMIKELGTKSAIDFVGGWETFCKIMNINSPMDFLHLFDDLEVVNQKNEKMMKLFRYKEDNAFMYIYRDRKYKDLFISNKKIWSFLKENFGLNDVEIQELIRKWLHEVYKLRAIRRRINNFSLIIK